MNWGEKDTSLHVIFICRDVFFVPAFVKASVKQSARMEGKYLEK